MKKASLLFIVAFLLLFAAPLWATTYTVTNCADGGAGSLRQALASALSQGDEIVFDITTLEAGYATGESSPGLVTAEAGNTWFRIIVSATGLPTINPPNIAVRGSTQTREATNSLGPRIEVRGNASNWGFTVIGPYCTIEGLAITGFSGATFYAIELTNPSADSCQIKGNYIGVSPTGETGKQNYTGISIINGAHDNVIGGTATGEGNIISGNTCGITITGNGVYNNQVLGNLIGTNANGTAVNPNTEWGISIESTAFHNKIGNGTQGGRNVIMGTPGSGGNSAAIMIGGSGTVSNEVLGNYIGIGADGATVLSGSYRGVSISNGASQNRIGNGTAGGKNVISGNSDHGIYIAGSGTISNEVLGNYIGIKADGITSAGNGASGVFIGSGASFNRIGSSESTSQRNIICGQSGSGDSGITVNASTRNYIEGNWIGLGTDESAVANYYGIQISSNANSNEVINNVISGNSQDGIYIAGFARFNRIRGNKIGLDSAGTTQKANSQTGIFITNANDNIIGGTSPADRNYIAGNGNNGLHLANVSNTRVFGNYIGLKADGETILTNNQYGIYIRAGNSEQCQDNLIGTSEAGGGNLMIGSSSTGNCGIFLIESGDGNVANNRIINNIIGLTSSEAIPSSQGYCGIKISGGAHHNYIGGTGANEGNVISGNSWWGIIVFGNGTNSNEVSGNFIGTDSTGTNPRANATGIQIETGASYNRIGNGTAAGKNIISGNTSRGIVMDGSNTYRNQILGNYIGTDINGTTAIKNGNGGLVLQNATNCNKIGDGTSNGRNIIASDDTGSGWGIYITASGTNSNEVLGNYIGTDVNGSADFGFLEGIHIRAGAQYNKVGDGNVISGNQNRGIELLNSGTIAIGTSSNEIYGNFIGTQSNGITALPNGQGGIHIHSTTASSEPEFNRIGSSEASKRNIISGNTGYGIWLQNVRNNYVEGNWIGLATNESQQGNTNGIEMTDASYSNHVNSNVISGNSNYGINITGSGTNSNEVLGNAIGTDSTGSLDRGNTSHGINIASGASFNIIGNGNLALGRNLISGNGENGIYLDGSTTLNNKMLGNLIGTNITGTASLANGWSGIEIASAQDTEIGDGTAGGWNLISGNGDHGITITTSATGTRIKGNYIGTDVNGTANLGNTNTGVSLYSGSSTNEVGPSNIIAFNGSDGVLLSGASTAKNVVTLNSIFYNTGKGIAITSGANPTTSTPEVGFASYNELTQLTLITGESAPALGTVEVFKAQGHQGKTYLGSTLANGSGNWSIVVSGLVSGDAVVATGTTANPETSEFSSTEAVVTGVAKQYQPDNLIATLESGADYVGEGIYNSDGSSQTRTTSINTGESSTFYIKIENDGNTTDEVLVTAAGSSSNWSVTFYNAKTGGSDITSQIFGSGWSTGSISSTESKEVRMVALNSGTTLSTLEVLITSTSTYDSSADTVKASATAVPIPAPTSEVDHFEVSAPASAIANTAFSLMITAKDSSNQTEEIIIGTTTLSADDGTITPESIDSSEFSAGIWSGNVTLSKAGIRTVTVINAGATGSAQILVSNATLEFTSTDLGISGMTITVPAGAASSEVSISATEITTPLGDFPPGFYIAGKTIDIIATPSQFLLPVTVTLPINGPLKDPRVYYWDGTEWSRDGITIVSYTDTSITFTTTHFTIFAPMAASSSNLVRFGPNPYNPYSGTIAKIWYWLDRDYETSIYVMDITGNLVWRNSYDFGTNGGKSGANSVNFEGQDRNGKVLGDGVYLYKIIQDGKIIGGGKIAIIK